MAQEDPPVPSTVSMVTITILSDEEDSPALPTIGSLEARTRRLLGRVEERGRPFMLELFGIPKSGKTTITEMLRDYFRRNGYEVAAPQEGARAVELPRAEPQINFAYTEYALGHARRIAADKRIHIGLFDRAIWDGVVRMDYYRDHGQLTPEQAEHAAGYYLLPPHAALFDVHVCLMAEPHVALARKNANLLSKRYGKTANPTTMRELEAAHVRTWEQRALAERDDMTWIDSSEDDPITTGTKVLDFVLGAFERAIDGE